MGMGAHQNLEVGLYSELVLLQHYEPGLWKGLEIF